MVPLFLFHLFSFCLGYRNGVICGPDVTREFPYVHFITHAMSTRLHNHNDDQTLLTLYLLLKTKSHPYLATLPPTDLYLPLHFNDQLSSLLPDQEKGL